MATRADSTYERKTTEKYESTDPPADAPPSGPGEDKEKDGDASSEEDEKPADGEPDAKGEEDEPEASAGDKPADDKPEASAKPEAKPAATAPARASADASTAEILGLPNGAGELSIRSAALRMRTALDRCMKELGSTTLDGLVGDVKASAADSRRMAAVLEENRKLVKKSRFERRMASAKKLVAADLPGCTRGEIYIDIVGEDGKRTGVKLAPEYAQMKLETFEAFVDRKLKNAGPRRAQSQSPFQPDPKSAKEAPNAARLASAMKNPVVIAAAQRTDATLEQCAEAFIASGLNNGSNLVPDTLGQ